MASEKMKYILRRAEQSALRTDIELSPLKREIESIFNPRNIDMDCKMISNLLLPYEKMIKEDMSKGNHRNAFETFLEILESLSYYFVKDEHFCYFDDMYCPDYSCSDILKSIIAEIKSGKSCYRRCNLLRCWHVKDSPDGVLRRLRQSLLCDGLGKI